MSALKVCRIAILASIMMALQVGLSGLPNIEVVSIIILCGALAFGQEMLLTTIVFSGLEILVWGFGVWNIMYLTVWNVLVIIALLLRRVLSRSIFISAIVNALFGLSFGALCSVTYLIISGPCFAFTWWVSGLPYDLLHCAGNFVTGLILYKPLMKVFRLAKIPSYIR